MSCLFPLKGFDTGLTTESGKKDLIITASPGDFLSYESLSKIGRKCDPKKLVSINGVPGLNDPIPIPCGSCVGCRLDRAKDWTARLLLESAQWPHRYFVTLTYDDEHLPLDDKSRPVLVKLHLSAFLKRLRNIFKFRFFGCGEYGDLTGRPHYHLILFSQDPLFFTDRIGINRFHSDSISKCWCFGLHEVSNAEAGCFAYVAGYCAKKQKEDLSCYPVPPFILMSRRPGIGATNLNLEGFRDFKIHGKNGSYYRLPRYVRDKLPWFTEELKQELVYEAKKCADAVTDLTGLKGEHLGFYKDGVLKTQVKERMKI